MRHRALVVDALLAAIAFCTSIEVVDADLTSPELRAPDVAAYLLLAVFSFSILLRRRSPEGAVFLGVIAGVVYAAAQYPPALTPIVLLSVYTAGDVLPGRRSRIVVVGAFLLAFLGATLSPGPTDTGIPVLVGGTWLLGTYIGSRRAYTAELERKNQDLRAAQAELAERAATEERLRIARELHDVVAHTMSVVAVQAGTGRLVAEDDPAAARAALATIETATRSALLEMRRLLGVLRQPGELAPAPGLRDVDRLVAEVTSAGVAVAVDLSVDGERPDLPAGVDLAAYRIVQEALTNVIKHAGPAHATVTIRYGGDALTIEVDDDGAAPSTTAKDGHGLPGMRERAAMYDGEVTAGPRPDGRGFRVTARLPYGTGAGAGTATGTGTGT
ncbi:MAG: sensor histidine kinase [Acidimicrobiales bacterium]